MGITFLTDDGSTRHAVMAQAADGGLVVQETRLYGGQDGGGDRPALPNGAPTLPAAEAQSR